MIIHKSRPGMNGRFWRFPYEKTLQSDYEKGQSGEQHHHKPIGECGNKGSGYAFPELLALSGVDLSPIAPGLRMGTVAPVTGQVIGAWFHNKPLSANEIIDVPATMK